MTPERLDEISAAFRGEPTHCVHELVAELRKRGERERRAAAEQMREAAARVIDEGQESFVSSATRNGYYLSPRRRGNLAGLAYAEAIRALPVEAALDALPPDSGGGWRHKKRGTTYRIVGEASSQVVGEPIGEGDTVVVYRADSDGSLWVRRKDEFYDGRFEQIFPPTDSEDRG